MGHAGSAYGAIRQAWCFRRPHASCDFLHDVARLYPVPSSPHCSPDPPTHPYTSHPLCTQSKARVDRVKRRLAERMSPAGKPTGFCLKPQEKKPPEAYFAVDGDEEKLPPEYEPQPPRRGGGGGGATGGEQRQEGEEGQEEGGGQGQLQAMADNGAQARGERDGAGSRRLSGEALVAGPGQRVATAEAGVGAEAEAEPPAPARRHSGGSFPTFEEDSAEMMSPPEEEEDESAGVTGILERRRRRRKRRRREGSEPADVELRAA